MSKVSVIDSVSRSVNQFESSSRIPRITPVARRSPSREKGECTLRLMSADDHMLARLLVAAEITTSIDTEVALKVALTNKLSLLEVCRVFFLFTPQMCSLIAQVLDEHFCGKMDFAESIKCLKQAFLTGAVSFPSEHLCAYNGSIMDFLKAMNVLSADEMLKAGEPDSAPATVLAARLVSLGLLSNKALRSATRLRYLFIRGEVSLARAKRVLVECMKSEIEVEQFFPQFSATA